MEMSWVIVCCLLCSLFNIAKSQSCSESNLINSETLPVASRSLQTLSSPGWRVSYYPNMDCQWRISAGNGNRVVVDVREYIIEDGEGSECVYDYLQFFDGSSTSVTVTTVCSTARQGKLFVSTGPDAILRLKSDSSIQQAGFTMRYFIGKTEDQNGCSAEVTLTATSTVQYLTNKQWPDSYDENTLCRWQINSSGKVEMEILFSDMVSGEECFSDTLEIFDGSSRTDPSLTQGFFCDSRSTFPSRSSMTFTTSGSSAYIRFRSIASGYSRHGFVLSFKEVAPTVTTTQAPTTTTTQPPNDVCSSGTIQLTATNNTQYIQSPNYPVFYSTNLFCSWLIAGSEDSLVQLKVIDSYLEDSEGCVGDYVRIHDGDNAEAAVIATYCGEISSSVNSTSNKLYIQFRSDGSVGQRGFHLEYTTLSEYSSPACIPPAGVTNLVANTTAEYLESPNYPDKYNSSITTYWLIHNPTGSGYIRLEVEDSRIEADPYCSYDKVTVYRGPCTTYPVLGSFCGVQKPTITQYTGAYVLVAFTTDSNAEFKGFRIKYYITTERETTSTPWKNVAIIAGAVVGGIIGVALIAGLAIAIKRGKLPGMKSKGHKRRRLSSASSMSSISSSDESDNEAKRKRRPKTALRSKTKVKLPPVKANVDKLPKLPLSIKSKIPPISK
ncbi:bone morphogenetic protein 1-like [Ostrea edulis]|uniref:bone morphogenetic protein 1-like n=1 Tax=Ostrea edulis TaxID=37623 RepID=UPI0024AEAB23|nr:bone morphogenetic protein 1-like [Ostrea edulis]